MRLTIENLGRIEHAELALRPLTVLVGENGTNKTWTALAAYGALRAFAFERLLRPGMGARILGVGEGQRLAASLPDSDPSNRVTWEATFAPEARRQRDHTLDARALGALVGANVDAGATATLSGAPDAWGAVVDAVDFTVHTRSTGYAAEARFHGRVTSERLANLDDRARVERFVQTAIHDALRSAFGRAAWMPVERATLLESLAQGKDVRGPADGGSVDHLAFWVDQAADALRRPGAGQDHGFPRLSAVTGTRVEVGEAMSFWERRANAVIPLRAAATMTRGLAPLDVYLRTLAQPGDWIVLDEPELSAHPAGQLAIAEWLAVLVARGLRFLITTHSPYLLDHLETLVSARASGAAAMDRVRARRPGLSDDAFLRAEDLAVHEFVEVGDRVVVREAYDPAVPEVTTRTFGRVSDEVMYLLADALDP